MEPMSPMAPNVDHGRAYRIAPGLSGRQAASFWKFWTTGDEIYASCRSWRSGRYTKVSVHKSGQIHLRIGEMQQVLAKPLLLGTWLHAFELRFLRSPGAFFPRAENLKNKKGFSD
jgi:hypothetical protein